MNKEQLIQAVIKKSGVVPEAVRKVFSVTEKEIKHEINKGEQGEVRLVNFMRINRVYVEPRKAKNPRSGKTVITKGHYVVKIRPYGNWFE